MVRFKNRYIVIGVTPKDKDDKLPILKAAALQNAIQKKIQQLYGDFGQAAIKFGFTATYCNTNTGIALVRGRHGPHNFLTTVIPTLTDIGGRHVSVEILHIGATMKHCFLFIRNHQHKEIELLWGSLKNDHDKRKIIDKLMTLTPSIKDLK